MDVLEQVQQRATVAVKELGNQICGEAERAGLHSLEKMWLKVFFVVVCLNLLEDKPPRTVVAEPPSMDITKA